MVRFEDIATETIRNVRMLNRAAILRMINELRGRAEITVHDDRILQLDQDVGDNQWPFELHHKEVMVNGLFSYKEALMKTSMWSNFIGVTIRFPYLSVIRTYVKQDYAHRGPNNQYMFIQHWYPTPTGTEVECRTDTDALYEQIVKAYKRYKGKEKKIAAINKVWVEKAAKEQAELEAKGQWNGVENHTARW